MNKIFEKLDQINVSNINWRAFCISFAGIFFMQIVHILGIQSPISMRSIITPQKMSELKNGYNSIGNKLMQNENNFKLNKKLNGDNNYAYATGSSEFNNSSSYIVIDYDSGDILESKECGKRLPIASLTKIMTSVVALDLALEGDRFTVSDHAAQITPTKIGVIPGESMTLNELLHAALMTSANDAVQVIKEGIDEKYKARIFVNAMNKKAHFLGMNNTHFENPQGFDSEENYSTAEDMAILSHYALENYPLIKDIVKKDYALLPKNNYHKQFDLYNWNGLIGVYPNVLGLKIGNTDQAGMTTIVLSEREGKKVLVVLLGASGILERDLGASQLLDAGFKDDANLPEIGILPEQLQAKYSTWQYWN